MAISMHNNTMLSDALLENGRIQETQRQVESRELLEPLWADRTRLITPDRTLLASDECASTPLDPKCMCNELDHLVTL